MSLMPWKQKKSSEEAGPPKPWSASLDQFSREMDRLFERFFRDPWSLSSFAEGSGWSPSVDVSESPEEVTVRAEVAGVEPQNLDIHIAGEFLVIAGEKKQTEEKTEENFHHSESFFGSFERRIPLPASIDVERVSADHAHGVVTIHLPKKEKAKPKRIEINPS